MKLFNTNQIQFKFFLSTICSSDALQRITIDKIVPGNAFEKDKKKPGLKFNPVFEQLGPEV